MEIKNLTTFVQVAELGSFSRAGERLGYSQPSVSVQIRQLEEELGFRLFDRIGHAVRLTDKGRDVLAYAQQVCGEHRIAGILGGFHLLEASERVEQTAAFLKAVQPAALYPCHCVSLAAKLILARTLEIQEAGSGLSLEL